VGYRAEWLTHAGAIAVHDEVALEAFDREVPPAPLRLLLVGIGNGGCVEVWRRTLPKGATVTALDSDPACAALPGIDPVLCDVTDKVAVREALRGCWFDCIIDATGKMSPHTWPFLAPGCTLLYEGYDPEVLMALSRSVALQGRTWLPVEEVLSVTLYSAVAVILKRNPMVAAPVSVMTGNFGDIIPERDLVRSGVKRALVQ
jgi:hypothetical protein